MLLSGTEPSGLAASVLLPISGCKTGAAGTCYVHCYCGRVGEAKVLVFTVRAGAASTFGVASSVLFLEALLSIAELALFNVCVDLS